MHMLQIPLIRVIYMAPVPSEFLCTEHGDIGLCQQVARCLCMVWINSNTYTCGQMACNIRLVKIFYTLSCLLSHEHPFCPPCGRQENRKLISHTIAKCVADEFKLVEVYQDEHAAFITALGIGYPFI